MSLYNTLFGYNPMAGILLTALNIKPDNIPRFRDCFLSEDSQHIIVYTRTGGGNRNEYANSIQAMRELPGFVKDEDDDFDNTYANFYFDIPSDFKELISTIITSHRSDPNPAERWRQLFADLESKKQTPETERALKLGKEIFGKIIETLK